MRNYTILRKPENLDWSTIPAASIDNLLWTPSVDITSKAQLCYDGEAIYVRLSAKEANIRAEENGPLGTPCQDSCLEFFFAPIEGDDRYKYECYHTPDGTYAYPGRTMSWSGWINVQTDQWSIGDYMGKKAWQRLAEIVG